MKASLLFKRNRDKTITIYSRKYTHLRDGRPCTPYFKEWYYHGNIFLSTRLRKVCIHPWFYYTGGCLHILGFRFTLWVGVRMSGNQI